MASIRKAVPMDRRGSEGIEKASARILETFNNDSSEKEEVNETNNNSSIAEVTKEMANELKRYRVELKLFDDENIRKSNYSLR